MEVANSPSSKITSRRVLQIIGSFIGLISAVIGIYAFFFNEPKILLEYEILTNTNVLDINADITKLDITYAGASLKNKHENLRIINLRVKNNGNECILKSHYDEQDPIGLTINYGKIIEKPELVHTSNEYLKKNLKIKFDSSGRVVFNTIILEPAQSFTIKLLILHRSVLSPTILSFGKIAGQNSIPLISLIAGDKDQKSFLQETFSGGIFSQLLRGIVYFLIVIIIIIIITVIIFQLSEVKEKKKRKNIVKNFKSLDTYDGNRMNDAIFSRFEEFGPTLLFDFEALLKNEEKLNVKYREWIQSFKKEDLKSSESNDTSVVRMTELSQIKPLIDDGYAIKDSDKLIVNQPMKKTLTHFLSFLQEKGYKKKHSFIVNTLETA